MKMSMKLTGEGLTRALRRLAHRAVEAGEEARRASRLKKKAEMETQDRDDARRRV
ncbi:MAG: hypothetical protein VYB05_00130 [Pseudomonadota bacterium]|nr:hypothetical protein [Pseudomonadota bacterium]